MSNAHSGSTYRRRLGRAPSPPTWLWYEQIPFADDSSDSDNGDGGGSEYESCSEDDEDYGARREQQQQQQQQSQQHENGDHSSSASDSGSDDVHDNHDRPSRGEAPPSQQQQGVDGNEKNETENMELDDDAKGSNEKDGNGGDVCAEGGEAKKDVKGKQRAVDPPPEVDTANESAKHRERRKKQRKPVYTFRPILTIQKSQGFVWNQDLFVPPYIKDRYVTSTSPPNAKGPAFSSSSSMNPCHDYEVDVVEIRVEEGEYADIIPSRTYQGDPPYRSQ